MTADEAGNCGGGDAATALVIKIPPPLLGHSWEDGHGDAATLCVNISIITAGEMVGASTASHDSFETTEFIFAKEEAGRSAASGREYLKLES